MPRLAARPPPETSAPALRGAGSVGRIFDILDLISTDLPVLRAEDVMARLGYTKSTAYRYLKTLCDVGLLAQAGGGIYALGPRVVELERLMYLTDPLLQAAQREMPGLLEPGANSVVLLSSLYRDRVLCLRRLGPEAITIGGRPITLLRERGLPLPLFQGAASLAILSHLPSHRARALHAARAAEIARAGLGADWPAFRARLAGMRRNGHVVTIGQFNPVLAAIAVPVLPQEGEVRASLTRILPRAGMPAEGPGPLIAGLKAAAARISAQSA